VQRLRQAYHLADVAPDHILRRACDELERLRADLAQQRCPYIRSSSEGTHWCALAAQPDAREALAAAEASDAESIAMYRRCRDDRDRMRKAMRLALEALSRFMDDSPRPSDALFGRQAIDALRAALGDDK
jgi:hypothetical protein